MKKFILKMVVALNKKGYNHLITKIRSKDVADLTLEDIQKVLEYQGKLRELSVMEKLIQRYY